MAYEEYQKKELTFSLNDFNTPLELSGATAWTQMIMYLIELNPGDDPNDPEAGIGITRYEFSDVDTALDTIEDDINTQVRIYFPDIPFSSIELQTYDLENNDTVLMMSLIFEADSGDLQTAEVVMSNTTDGLKYQLTISDSN